MNKLSSKNKIYIAAFFWLVLCASMFGYFFKIFNTSAEALVSSNIDKQKQLALAKIEEDSFKQAKGDVAKLKSQQLQPEDFFSRDTTLVNEIKVLEDLKQKFSVVTVLSGVAGTVDTVPKTKIQGVVLYVPYTLSITGSFSDVMSFIESLENLSFITNILDLTLAGSGNNMTASFTANFYLKQ